jgi:hypothetical protein
MGESGVLEAMFPHEPIAEEDLARSCCWTLRGGASATRDWSPIWIVDFEVAMESQKVLSGDKSSAAF